MENTLNTIKSEKKNSKYKSQMPSNISDLHVFDCRGVELILNTILYFHVQQVSINIAQNILSIIYTNVLENRTEKQFVGKK